MEQLDAWSAQPLTPGLIQEIHRAITERTLEDPRDAGRVQRPEEDRVQVVDQRDGEVMHQPPPAAELPDRLQALCDFANDTAAWPPPVLRACILHFQLAHDHPFVDGNGRTARALFYWSLLRQGYRMSRFLSISRIIARKKRRYEDAFLHSEQSLDLTYFLRFHVHVVTGALDELGEYLERKRERVTAAARSLTRWPMLNLRQRQGVRDALQQPERSIVAKAWASTYGVSYPTGLTDLHELVALGLFTSTRIGRTYHFSPAEDLPRLVQDGPD